MGLETIEYNGFTIHTELDIEPPNPREWDNLGTMVCWHSRYRLGDVDGEKAYANVQDFRHWVEEQDVIILPLYLYDHSGITMNTTGFYSPWDSGQVGFVYVERETLRKEKLDDRSDSEIEDYLRSEVDTYDHYLRGEVYGFWIESPEGENIDSCWGFFDSDDAINEAKALIDGEVTEREERAYAQFAALYENTYV